MVTAYVATSPDPGAEQALKMIIERENAVAQDLPAGGTQTHQLPTREQLLGTGNVQTASLGGPETFSSLKGMFDMTFNSLTDNAASQPMQQALADLALSRQPNQSIELRPMDLVAPEIDHVNDTLVQPVPMSTAFWAEMTEAEGYAPPEAAFPSLGAAGAKAQPAKKDTDWEKASGGVSSWLGRSSQRKLASGLVQ